mgnify:CR=1 FL=1
MKYLSVEDNKEHLKTLVKWLVAEVFSASGDGDSFWYSRYYNISDIYDLLEEMTGELTYPGGQKLDWMLFMQNGIITWGIDQEALIVTNSEEEYKNAISLGWYQCIIRY